MDEWVRENGRNGMSGMSEWGRGIGVLFMVGGAECMGCGQGQGQGKGMARARAMTGRH